MYKKVLTIIGILFLGALGALFFNVSVLPYFLASTYFENFQFIKDIKQGKIVVNKTNQVYIQENTAIEDAVLRVEKSIVTIEGNYMTSGLIATSDGSIITLASAIPSNSNFNVFLQGEQVDFKVIKVDYENNLALLKIDKNNLQTVGFTDSDKIKLGQKVFLVAPTSTKQDNWFANEGIIREIDANSIKTDIVEKPSVTGGPLFNSAGELIGLNFVNSEGKISAIPINKIQKLLGL